MIEQLWALIIFAFTAAFTPGPNNIMLLASGLNYGIRASLPFLAGVVFGVALVFLSLGLGIGFLFDRLPWLHQWIKVVGVIYLFYLAWLIATAKTEISETDSKPLSFVQASLFQFVNPKNLVSMSSAIAAFTSTEGNIYVQVLLITLVFVMVALPSASTWLAFGHVLKRIINKPHRLKIFNVCMALLLVASVLPIAYQVVIDFLA